MCLAANAAAASATAVKMTQYPFDLRFNIGTNIRKSATLKGQKGGERQIHYVRIDVVLSITRSLERDGSRSRGQQHFTGQTGVQLNDASH